jgi:hypothetical protein
VKAGFRERFVHTVKDSRLVGDLPLEHDVQITKQNVNPENEQRWPVMSATRKLSEKALYPDLNAIVPTAMREMRTWRYIACRLR